MTNEILIWCGWSYMRTKRPKLKLCCLVRTQCDGADFPVITCTNSYNSHISQIFTIFHPTTKDTKETANPNLRAYLHSVFGISNRDSVYFWNRVVCTALDVSFNPYMFYYD